MEIFMEEITPEETLHEWMDNYWTTASVLEYSNKSAMLDAISEYKSELPEEVTSLSMQSELDVIASMLTKVLCKEDCITQVANIADLRRFRPIAMSAYDDGIERGLRPQNAQALAIEVVHVLNQSNMKENL